MAFLGDIGEIVSAKNLTLQVGSDTYRLVRGSTRIRVERTENRIPTTGAGPVYTVGQGNHFFTTTLFYTGPEVDGTAYTNSTTAASFNDLTEPASNGAMNEIAWKIVATDQNGNTKTFAASGYLRDYEVYTNEIEENVLIDIFVRVTGDTITIS